MGTSSSINKTQNCNQGDEDPVSLRFIVRDRSGTMVLSEISPNKDLFELKRGQVIEGMFRSIQRDKPSHLNYLSPVIGNIYDWGKFGSYLRGCLDLRVGAHSSQCAAIFLFESSSDSHGEYVYVIAFDSGREPSIQEVMRSVMGLYRV